MKKIILLFVVIMMATVTSVFGNSTSRISFESQVGFSQDSYGYSFINSTTSSSIIQNNSVSIGENVKYNFGNGLNFVVSGSYSNSISSDYISKYDETYSSELKDTEAQDSLRLFIGLEKEFDLTDNLSLNIASGINSLYFFDNISMYFVPLDSAIDSSNISYGFMGYLNLEYKIQNNLKFSVGISALYNPILSSEFAKVIDILKSEGDKVTLYAYSVNPTFGITYIL